MSRLDQILEMLKEDPEDPFLNYALGLEYAKEGATAKAIEIISVLISRDENYLGGYYQLGKLYEEAGQPENAAATYSKGMGIAKRQGNRKAAGELNEALMMLED